MKLWFEILKSRKVRLIKFIRLYMPTVDQAIACVRVCQMLSNSYQPIHIFRYNANTNTVFILAGVTESLEVLIFPDGQWRFNDDEA